MSSMFTLPQGLAQTELPPESLESGEYVVRILKASARSSSKLAIFLEVVEEGHAKGVQIWENLNLEYSKGRSLLGDLLDALGISRASAEIDLDAFTGKTLCVTVERSGQWLNVTGHRPEF